MTNLSSSLSVKVIVYDQHGQVLLLQRSQASKNNAGKWEFPGGKLDPGESFDEALLREVQEETGLAIILRGSFDICESKRAKPPVGWRETGRRHGNHSLRLAVQGQPRRFLLFTLPTVNTEVHRFADDPFIRPDFHTRRVAESHQVPGLQGRVIERQLHTQEDASLRRSPEVGHRLQVAVSCEFQRRAGEAGLADHEIPEAKG